MQSSKINISITATAPILWARPRRIIQWWLKPGIALRPNPSTPSCRSGSTVHPFSSPMNQRQFPASLNRFLTWLMLAAAVAAVAVLLTGGGVAEAQSETAYFRYGHEPPTVGVSIAAGKSGGDRVRWEWEISDDSTSGWTIIPGPSSFEYRPVADDVGKYLRAVWVYTGSGGTGYQTETPAAGPVDGPPTFGSETITNQTYTVDTAIPGLNLPGATGGNGALTYDLTPEVAGLTFGADHRTLSGTPTAVNTYSMMYKVVDADTNNADTDSATISFTITVQTAPLTFATTDIADQSYTVNQPIDILSLPLATGGTGAITYTLAPALPIGLSFDGKTRKITGIPTTESASTQYIYTATDSATPQTLAKLEFNITVTVAAPPAPTNLQANPGTGEVTLSWDSAADDTITGYERQQDGGGWEVVLGGPSSRSVTITALTDGQSYTFRVRAMRDTVEGIPASVNVALATTCASADLRVDQSKAVPSATFDLRTCLRSLK